MASNELIETLNAIKLDKDTNLLPENIKSGVTVLGVDGTLESNSGVKLFETVEEMQADANPQEGDLAVVYREDIQNMTGDTQTQYITFPETVILPETVTAQYNCRLRAIDDNAFFDGDIQLSSTSFRFNGYSEVGMIRVQYTSTDGVNYTRTNFQGDSGDLTNTVDLGTSVGVYRSDGWNDNFGYFMQIGGMEFDGLYEYTTQDDVTNTYFYGNFVNNSSNLTYDKVKINTDLYNQAVSLFLDSEYNNKFQFGCIEYVSDTELNILYDITNSLGYTQSGCLLINDNTAYFAHGISTVDVSNYELKKYNINLTNSTVQEIDISNDIQSYTINSKYTTIYTSPITNPIVCFDQNGNIYQVSINDYNTLEQLELIPAQMPKISLYVLAPNQYNLTSSNQLLPNIKGYGKNGNVTGDGTIWNNIPAGAIYSNVLDIDLSNLDKSKNNIPNSDGVLKYNHVYGFSKTSNDFGSMCSLSSSTQYDYKSNYGVNIILNNILYDLVFTENTNSYSVVEMNLDDFSYTTEDTGTFPETITDLLGIINYQNKLYLFCISSSKIYCYNYDINLHKLTNIWSISMKLKYSSTMLLYDNDLGKIYIRDVNNRIFKVDVVSGDYSTIINNLSSGYANSSFMINNSPYFAISDETNGINVYKKSDNSLLISQTGTSSYAKRLSGFSFNGYTYITIWNNNNLGFKINEADDTYETVKFDSIFVSSPYQKMYQTIIQDEINKNALYIISTAHSGQSKIVHFDTTTLTAKTMYSADNNAMEMIYLLDDMYLTINRYKTQVGKYLIGGITNLFNSNMPILINNDYIYTSIDNYNSVDYTGTISPEEYTTAVNTTEQILGNE